MNYSTKCALENLQKIRETILKELNKTSLENIFAIPDGFNNNIIWQAGHILATQQIFHYKLTGQTPRVDLDLIERYKKGTCPSSEEIDQEELDIIRMHLNDRVQDLISDYNRLNSYTQYTTGFGVELNSIDEAISFNNIHEALHLGRIAMMRKMLTQ